MARHVRFHRVGKRVTRSKKSSLKPPRRWPFRRRLRTRPPRWPSVSTFKARTNKLRKTNENLIFVAEENLKKAELSYDSIKRSVARGLISQLQLQGEEYRVDAARKELELAKQTLDVLDNFTKEKMVTQLESDIRATKIQAENAESSYQEELSKLKEIEEQLTKCKVYRPTAGQVVYANVFSSRGSSEFVVEPGAPARERQVVLTTSRSNDKCRSRPALPNRKSTCWRSACAATVRVEAIG